MTGQKFAAPSRLLLSTIICVTFSACSHVSQQQQAFAPPPISAEVPPDLRPPQPPEVQEAIKRVYGQTVAIESGRSQSFVMGDLNGDSAPDLAVIVRPAEGKLVELNHELANWMRGNPQMVKLPGPKIQGHGRTLPPLTGPVVIEQNDVLLAIIHGYGPAGWRHPQARQSYLLRNAVGNILELHPLNMALKLSGRPPQLRGDVLRETLAGEPGLLYYTGAHYAWHRLIPSKS